MPTLKIEKSGPTLFGFKHTGPGGSATTCSFTSSGTFETELTPAGTHHLEWEVRGAPGTKFSYKVTLDGTVVEELPDASVSAGQREVGSIEMECP